MNDLKDKNIIVTGATGGIGNSIVKKFYEYGANILASGTKIDKLEKLKSNSISSVSFGTEAGVFNKVGFETIVCGPGSIEQAHKPNEYIEEKQLKKCDEFLTKIIDFLY